mmetsp:Transcript_24420/g.46322  ORF Transcript_24420/g.46322 Transcript_24420/m.46322 type:complete len:332 (-) Transcript_24420:437-1432(-)
MILTIVVSRSHNTMRDVYKIGTAATVPGCLLSRVASAAGPAIVIVTVAVSVTVTVISPVSAIFFSVALPAPVLAPVPVMVAIAVPAPVTPAVPVALAATIPTLFPVTTTVPVPVPVTVPVAVPVPVAITVSVLVLTLLHNLRLLHELPDGLDLVADLAVAQVHLASKVICETAIAVVDAQKGSTGVAYAQLLVLHPHELHSALRSCRFDSSEPLDGLHFLHLALCAVHVALLTQLLCFLHLGVDERLGFSIQLRLLCFFFQKRVLQFFGLLERAQQRVGLSNSALVLEGGNLLFEILARLVIQWILFVLELCIHLFQLFCHSPYFLRIDAL